MFAVFSSGGKQHRVTEGETILVYDLSGGTFDVSVVVVEQGVVEVKASHGDTHLGGDDFHQLLVDRAVRHFRERHGVDLATNSANLRRFSSAASVTSRSSRPGWPSCSSSAPACW